MALETNATPTLSFGAPPVLAVVVAAEQDRLAHLGVDERFVLILVPAEAPEQPQAVRHFLLRVEPEAIFHSPDSSWSR